MDPNQIESLSIGSSPSIETKHQRRLSGSHKEIKKIPRKNLHSVNVTNQPRLPSESPIRSLNPIKEDVKGNQHKEERHYFLTIEPDRSHSASSIQEYHFDTFENNNYDNNQNENYDLKEREINDIKYDSNNVNDEPLLTFERLDQPL